jgi:predicted acylesterase/phospholipase RssA
MITGHVIEHIVDDPLVVADLTERNSKTETQVAPIMRKRTDHDEIVGDLKLHPRIREIAGKKVGLVLSGGGAKGAYQAGCLQTLYDLGIDRFHCITGTSVGSLNGAGAASGRIPELVNLWQTINFSRVFKPSWRLFPSIVGELYAAFFYMIGCWLVVGIIALVFLSLAFLHLLNPLCILPLLLLLYFTAFREFTSRMSIKATRVKRATRASTSIMDNSPLRQTLEEVLYPDGAEELKIHCPVFVTVACGAYWFDPDYPTFWPRTAVGYSTDYNLDDPYYAHDWIPKYLNITTQSKNDLLDALLESAALPFAFRRKVVDGIPRMDGGVIENVPLNKILEYDCDLIIVIYLSSDESDPQAVLKQVPRLRRALKLAEADQSHLYQLYLDWKNSYFESHPTRAHLKDVPLLDEWELPSTNQPIIFPLESLDSLPPIIHVVPRRGLGGLLRGTLNFRKSKAKRLILLGREDMLTALQAHLGEDLR